MPTVCPILLLTQRANVRPLALHLILQHLLRVHCVFSAHSGRHRPRLLRRHVHLQRQVFTQLFLTGKLTITPTDAYDDFDFGCAQNSEVQFGAAAGLLGLGRTSISFVEQTSQKYKQVFSYCLPSTSSSTGYLKFGPDGGSGNAVKFTPLKTLSQSATFYALDPVGITVGSRQLKISASIFSKSGTVIDSGTVITRLPATPYAALRAAFRKAMEKYPFAKSESALLDTCYDFSGLKTVSYPKIGFVFGGGVTVDLDATGVLFQTSGSQFCLAFAGNKDDSNVQQKRLQVVYDVARGKIGFGPAGCP